MPKTPELEEYGSVSDGMDKIFNAPLPSPTESVYKSFAAKERRKDAFPLHAIPLVSRTNENVDNSSAVPVMSNKDKAAFLPFDSDSSSSELFADVSNESKQSKQIKKVRPLDLLSESSSDDDSSLLSRDGREFFCKNGNIQYM